MDQHLISKEGDIAYFIMAAVVVKAVGSWEIWGEMLNWFSVS